MIDSTILDLVPASVRAQWKCSGFYPDQSLYEQFVQRANRHPDREAVCAEEGTRSYGALLEDVRRLVMAFQGLGVVAGDVIAYQLPNSWKCIAIDLAAAAVGAISCPIPMGRGRLDFESLIRRCQPRCVIIDSASSLEIREWLDAMCASQPSLRHRVLSGAQGSEGWLTLDDFWRFEPVVDGRLPPVDPDGPARFLVSSGTESEPKLVAYSHNALMGGRGRFLETLHGETSPPRAFYLVPLASAFGSSATAGILCWLGGTLILNSGFDPARVIQTSARYQPDYLLGVPTMFQRLLADPALTEAAMASVRAVISGGALVDEATVTKCCRTLGCDFVSLYGSADGVNCHHRRGESMERVIGTVGRPNPAVCEIRIVDPRGQPCPPNELGEVIARGPLSPMQYVNAPELDERYRDPEGWVRTGDLGLLDEQGYLVLKGRIKDTIIRGGMNVSPAQIEAQVSHYPHVVSAACVPVPDPDLGQRIGLCLSMEPTAPRPRITELNRYLGERGLERHKLPEYVRYYRHLPLSPAGKVDKKRLEADFYCLNAVPQATLNQAVALMRAQTEQHPLAPSLMQEG